MDWGTDAFISWCSQASFMLYYGLHCSLDVFWTFIFIPCIIFPTWDLGKDYFLPGFFHAYFIMCGFFNLYTFLKCWIMCYFWRIFWYFFHYWSFQKDTEKFLHYRRYLLPYTLELEKKKQNTSLIISLIYLNYFISIYYPNRFLEVIMPCLRWTFIYHIDK